MNLLHLAIIFFGGIFGGLYASSVGGGALATLPLLLLIGLPAHIALGTQRLGAVFLELASAARFNNAKKLNLKFAIPLGLIAAVGSIVGVTVVVQIDDKILNIIVSVMLLLAAAILFNKDKLPVQKPIMNRNHLIGLALSMILLGLYGGFFGAGFGVFIAITLVLFGYSFLESAAMGRVIGFCQSLAAMVIFAQHGLINYPLGVALGIGFAIGSWIGIGITLRKNERYIKSLLLLVILLSLVKVILNIFGLKFLG